MLNTAKKPKEKAKRKEQKGTERRNKGMVVIRYVKNLSEGVARVTGKHRVGVAMRSYRHWFISKTRWKLRRSVGFNTRFRAKL